IAVGQCRHEGRRAGDGRAGIAERNDAVCPAGRSQPARSPAFAGHEADRSAEGLRHPTAKLGAPAELVGFLAQRADAERPAARREGAAIDLFVVDAEGTAIVAGELVTRLHFLALAGVIALAVRIRYEGRRSSLSYDVVELDRRPVVAIVITEVGEHRKLRHRSGREAELHQRRVDATVEVRRSRGA